MWSPCWKSCRPASNNTQLTNVSGCPGNWPLYGSGGFWQAAAWACSQWNRTDDRCRLRRHKNTGQIGAVGVKGMATIQGVLALSPDNPRRTAKLLSLQPVEEIWGVGNRIAKKLHVMGITTALQLSLTNPTFIRKNFNVVLERTVRELNGELHFTGGSAAAETADCLQSQLRAADHHLRRNAPGRLPVCRARGGKVAR